VEKKHSKKYIIKKCNNLSFGKQSDYAVGTNSERIKDYNLFQSHGASQLSDSKIMESKNQVVSIL
jgi:hypothetical protein